jgi:hypothetical protein
MSAPNTLEQRMAGTQTGILWPNCASGFNLRTMAFANVLFKNHVNFAAGATAESPACQVVELKDSGNPGSGHNEAWRKNLIFRPDSVKYQ